MLRRLTFDIFNQILFISPLAYRIEFIDKKILLDAENAKTNQSKNKNTGFCSTFHKEIKDTSFLVYFPHHIGGLNLKSLHTKLYNKENYHKINDLKFLTLREQDFLNSITNYQQNFIIIDKKQSSSFPNLLTNYINTHKTLGLVTSTFLSNKIIHTRQNLFRMHFFSYIRKFQNDLCKEKGYDERDLFITKRIEDFTIKELFIPSFNFQIYKNKVYDIKEILDDNNLNVKVSKYIDDKQVTENTEINTNNTNNNKSNNSFSNNSFKSPEYNGMNTSFKSEINIKAENLSNMQGYLSTNANSKHSSSLNCLSNEYSITSPNINYNLTKYNSNEEVKTNLCRNILQSESKINNCLSNNQEYRSDNKLDYRSSITNMVTTHITKTNIIKEILDISIKSNKKQDFISYMSNMNNIVRNIFITKKAKCVKFSEIFSKFKLGLINHSESKLNHLI